MPSVQSVRFFFFGFWLLIIVRYASSAAANALPSSIRLDPTVCIIITLAKRVRHCCCSIRFDCQRTLIYTPTIKRMSVCSCSFFFFSRYLFYFPECGVHYYYGFCFIGVDWDCARENSLFVSLSFLCYLTPVAFPLFHLSLVSEEGNGRLWILPSFEWKWRRMEHSWVSGGLPSITGWVLWLLWVTIFLCYYVFKVNYHICPAFFIVWLHGKRKEERDLPFFYLSNPLSDIDCY